MKSLAGEGPSRTTRRVSSGFWIGLCLVLAGAPLYPGNVLAQSQSPIGYIYDDAGRLAAVVDPAGDTAIYSYDAVGNVLSISRRPSSQVSIINFAPGCALPGSAVAIYGTGFSTTASQNTVKFKGPGCDNVAATVTSAAATQITAIVPAGAATGPITVTTPNGSATSSKAFTIGCNTPAITDFSPKVGIAGTTVTITGTNFDPVSSNNRVAFNDRGQDAVSSSSPTTITTNVPSNATSGRISVATPAGKGVSAADFFVPPTPFTASDVEFTGRMAIGESKTVTIGTPQKIAMIVFDGSAGQRVSLLASSSTFGCCNNGLTVYKPDASTFASTSLNGTSGFIDAQTLSQTGTYTIVLDPAGSLTGSVTLTLYNVPPDATGTITSGGPSVTMTITTPGQNARLTFSGTTGQRVSLLASNSTLGCCGNGVTIVNPDTTTLASTSLNGTGVFIDPQTLPQTGTYTIVLDAQGAFTGSVTFTLYDVPPDATGSITIGGPSVTVTITTPGQNARLTFSGTTGQRVSLLASNSTLGCCGNGVTIVNPDTTTLASTSLNGSGVFIDAQPLPQTGTYTIVLDAQGNLTGSVTFTLYDVPPDATGSITIGGPSVTVTITTPGQNARLTFSGTTGQQVSLLASNSTLGCCGNGLTIVNPDTTTLASTSLNGSSASINGQTLPQAGTYAIALDAAGTNTGSVDFSLTSP